jgi:hypothetical protein
MRTPPFAALAASLAAAVVLAGCGSTQWAGAMSTGTPVAPPGGGTTVITGPAGGYASVTITGTAANVVYWMTGVGIYAAMLMDERQHNGPLFPAPMREDRKVEEVDCTRPVPEELIGNLRCK